MVDAHTSGINFFLNTTTTLPVEYKILGVAPQPWESWHSYVAYKMRNILMGHLDMKLWRARVVMKLGVEKAFELSKTNLNDRIKSLNEVIGNEKETRELWIQRYEDE